MGTRSSAAPAAAKAAAETHTTEKMTSGKQATTPTGGHSRVPKREREEPENQDGEPLLKKVKTANLSPKADDGLMASLPGDKKFPSSTTDQNGANTGASQLLIGADTANPNVQDPEAQSPSLDSKPASGPSTDQTSTSGNPSETSSETLQTSQGSDPQVKDPSSPPKVTSEGDDQGANTGSANQAPPSASEFNNPENNASNDPKDEATGSKEEPQAVTGDLNAGKRKRDADDGADSTSQPPKRVRVKVADHDGPVPGGLRNLGNNCFVSAAMQAMAACPEFRAELARLFEGEAVQDPLSANLRDKIERLAPMPRVTRQNEEAVNRAYAHEMKIRRKIAAALGEPVKYTNEMNQFINSQMFKTSEERPSPVRIGEALKKVYNGSRYLSGVVQGDAGEIMTQSLGRLEKENEGWDSPFKGQWALEKTCTNPKCKAVTESSESFSRLSAMPMFLPRPSGRQSASIVDVIELECSLDNLPRDCDVCESPNQPAKRTSKVISVLPQYLMVELSRAATGIKDGKPVKTPASMNVKWKNGTRRFHSIAKVTHQGGIEGGHYVAYARYGDDWYKYNDAKRTCVKATTALGAQASVLIYEAEDEDIVAEKGEETKKDEKAEAEAETEQ